MVPMSLYTTVLHNCSNSSNEATCSGGDQSCSLLHSWLYFPVKLVQVQMQTWHIFHWCHRRRETFPGLQSLIQRSADCEGRGVCFCLWVLVYPAFSLFLCLYSAIIYSNGLIINQLGHRPMCTVSFSRDLSLFVITPVWSTAKFCSKWTKTGIN